MNSIIRINSKKIFLISSCTLLFIFPLYIKGDFGRNILFQLFLTGTLAVSWNILAGFGGQLSMGHVLFFGIGGYTSTILFLKFGISPWLGSLVGIILCIITCLLFSLLFKLKGLFFSLATAGITYIFKSFASYFKNLTNGMAGLAIPYKPRLENFIFESTLPYIYLSLALLLLSLFISYKIKDSKLGYCLMAIREDEITAEALGINVFKIKTITLIITACFYSIAGTLFTQYSFVIDPNSAFSFGRMIDIIVVTAVGGLGLFWGPVIGTAILIPLMVYFRGWFGGIFIGLDHLVYGILLMVVFFWNQKGVVSLIENIWCKIKG
ncbi:MAG: branched-chain amino acid ABC transporter permease [Promethearchaeota archaeon]